MMKKIVLATLLFIQIFAYENILATKSNIEKIDYPIVDIRLPSEWQATGVIPNVKKITFFLPNGRINQNFLEELKKYNITPNTKFAIICRTGHRSRVASKILEDNGYTKVVNLKGGMFELFKSLLKGVKYGKRK